VLAKNWNTPVPYWLGIPLTELREWIRSSNDVVRESEKK